MSKYLNYSAGMNLQMTDENGEEIYYRFGETTFSGSSGKNFKIAPNFKVLEMNQTTLKTKIRVFLDFVSLGGSGSGSAVKGYINGVQLENTYTSINRNQSRYMGSLDIEISHNQATGQGFIDIVCAVNSAWTGLGNAQSTTRIYTNSYPRGSTMGISSSTFVIGKTYSITVNSNSDDFKHKIAVLLDEGYTQSGEVNNPGYVIAEELYTNNKVLNTTVYAPNNFYNYLYGKKNAPGKIELTTQNNDGTQVGVTYSIPITISVDEEKDRPTISTTVTMTDYSSLTGSKTALISGYSNVTINVTATSKNNSVISSYNISNESKTYNASSVKFEKVSSGIFNISVVDNRGLSSLVDNKEYAIVPYVKLTLNTKVYRPQQTGNEIKVKVSGNFFNDSFGKVDNTLNLKFRYCEKGKSFPNTYTILAPTINEDNTFSGDLSLGTDFNYKKAYDFEFLVSDKLESFSVPDDITNAIHIRGTFEKFIEHWGIKSIEVSEDGGNLIINKNILIGDTGKKINDLLPVVLYESSTGTTGNIILNDSAENYSYIDIYFYKSEHSDGVQRVYKPNGKTVTLYCCDLYEPTNVQELFKCIQINDKNITFLRGIFKNTIGTTNYLLEPENLLLIKKVLGYK